MRQMEAANGLIALSPANDADYMRELKSCIRFGKPVVLKELGESLDMALDPLLLKETFKKGATVYIDIGNETIEYSPSFRLYLMSNLANPHYMPEAAIKVTLINFMITQAGLEDQVLGRTVSP